MKKNLRILICLAALLALSACGGGGSDNSGTPVPVASSATVVTLDLSEGNAAIGTIEIQLTLPEGFTLESDPEDASSASNSVAILAGNGDGLLVTTYTPESPFENARLTLLLADAEGFAPGPLFEIVRVMASGDILPLSTEFTVESVEAYEPSEPYALLEGYVPDSVMVNVSER